MFIFHIHHITGTFKNFYSSNISGFSSCNHYCRDYGYPFSSTALDLILNFQAFRMTISMCIYNWYITAAFSSKSYINSFLKLLPYLKFCPLPHVGSVSENSDHPLFFIVSHLRLKTDQQ